MQSGNDRCDFFCLIGRKALSDLDDDVLGIKVVFGYQSVNGLQIVFLIKQQTGLIDRDRNDGKSLVQPAALGTAYLFEDIQIKLGDEAVLLEDRDEVSRRYQRTIRSLPAHQCFSTDDLFGVQVVFGLQVSDKFAIAQRSVHVLFDMVFMLSTLKQGVIVEGEMVAVQVLDLCQCSCGTVLHQADVQFLGIVLIDLDTAIAVNGVAIAWGQFECADCIHDCGDTLADDRFILCVQKEAKLIGKTVIVNFICTKCLRENIGYAAQQTVTDRKAKRGVDKLKAV